MMGIEQAAGSRMVDWLRRPTSIVPLVVLRVAFGLVMFIGTVRFVARGWIETLYLQPDFHFTYYGFGWVKPLPGLGLYGVFALLALLALCIAAGAWYRFSMAAFFLLFTFVELLDKAYYLNHYYFISVLSFLLIWLPLHRWYSVDSALRPRLRTMTVPQWTVAAVRAQLGLVYFFAGVAKLKFDWLFHAMPLRIWLPAHADFPLLGPLFDQTWMAYAMSWGGALFDLSIPFLLLYRRTRPLAYLAVIGFHTLTGMLFPIGMFPAIMVACTLVFFSAEDWAQLRRWWGGSSRSVPATESLPGRLHRPAMAFFALFFLVQLLMPLRHWLYPGNVLWTEEGFRFSWNVMLAEKTGHVTFDVTARDAHGQQRNWVVYPSDYLTYQQEKQMSFQPDMIVEFAHHVESMVREQGLDHVAVRAEAYVSVNGRPSQLLIDPTVDLTAQHNDLRPKSWILTNIYYAPQKYRQDTATQYRETLYGKEQDETASHSR